LVLFMSLVSAGVDFVEVTNNVSTANHGDSVVVSFKAQEDSQGNLTSITFNAPITLTSGSNSFNSENSVTGAITSLSQNAISGAMTLTFNIPSGQVPGTYTGNLTLSGTYVGASTSDLPISITVNPSPSLSVTSTNDLTKTQNGTINVVNTGNVQLTDVVLTSSGDFTVSFSSNNLNLNPGDSTSVDVSLTDVNQFELGTNTVTITAADFVETSASSSVSYSIEEAFCSAGNQGGNLAISRFKIDNVKGFGEDDNEWYPLDKIEVELRIDNDGNDKISDIVVEWGVYNPATDEWVINEEENEFNLKKDKKETINLAFNLDPDDLSIDMDDDYIFYVKAYSDDLGEDNECASESKNIEITIESDFIVLDDIQVPEESVFCGSNVQISADVWNIGDEDQEDVYVKIQNKELGVNERAEIGDVDALDKEKLDVMIEIPEDAEEKTYYLVLSVYDEDDDIFENTNDDSSVFDASLKVEGSCGIEKPRAIVSANVESGGKAGEELVVRAVITNAGDELTTYGLNAAGYSQWASSAKIAPENIILSTGDSGEVLFTFDVNEDASGENMFYIEVLSGNEMAVRQPVSVNIEAPSGFKFPGITGMAVSKENWYLWAIGALNILLVIIIIVVAVRIARK